MKLRIIIGIIVVVAFAIEASGQTRLPEKFEVYTPEYIREQTNKWVKGYDSWQDYAISRIKKYDFGKPNKIAWTAYSDRDANTTYSAPSNAGTFSKLSFMEKVYIADIKYGFALIFTDEYAVNYPTINSSAKTKGWIPVDNLLLWEKCPQNMNSIFQKGLTHENIANNNSFQNSPYITSFKELVTEKKFEILFIMKTIFVNDERYYLLSKEFSIRERPTNVKGWMSGNYITLWDQRLCLEPTYSTSNVDYHKSKGLFPAVYSTLAEAEIFYKTGKQGSPSWIYKDFDLIRMEPYSMRFPIIDISQQNDNKFIYKVFLIHSNQNYFAPVKLKDTDNSLFDYVLFFSQDELKDIINELKKLESPSFASNRKAYQGTIVAMGQAFLGQMSADDIMGMSMDELTAQIYGFPVPISNCGVKIEDIIDRRKISDAQLQDYINDFNTKRRGLENIANNPYNGKFDSNEIIYLWIPLANMPGYFAE